MKLRINILEKIIGSPVICGSRGLRLQDGVTACVMLLLCGGARSVMAIVFLYY